MILRKEKKKQRESQPIKMIEGEKASTHHFPYS
jgi:hypothetical protein